MTEALHHRHKRPTTYYVSGPMRNVPKFNFPMFDSCARWLRSEGFNAINPADHDREIDPDCERKPGFATGDESLNDDPNMHFQTLLGWDLQQISAHECDGIVMLPGWEKSTGAAHERYVAEACGKQVWLAHYAGTTAAYHDPIRHPDGADSLEYHCWYMTLCEDRLLSSFTAESLRDALNASPVVPPARVRGWAEREPDTFPQDIAHVRQGSTFANVGINPFLNGDSLQPTPTPVQIGQFRTKDSGVREEFGSGMVRDTQEGKPRYDLIPLVPLKRLAELLARGAQKYGARNWEKASSQAEVDRFKASGFRHFVQWLDGDTDEDHASAVVFNVWAAMVTEEKL